MWIILYIIGCFLSIYSSKLLNGYISDKPKYYKYKSEFSMSWILFIGSWASILFDFCLFVYISLDMFKLIDIVKQWYESN